MNAPTAQATQIKVPARGAASMLPRLPRIPRARYLSEELLKAEIEHVFKKTWLGVGHVSEFEKEGSYRQLDLPFAPVFLVRGKDGEIRAFLNSCQHRGATVLKEKEGCAKSLSCQYHGWTYSLTGQLIGVPDEDSFQDLKKEQHSLVGLRCELWGGFVFINFDQNAPDLIEWLGPIAKRYTEIAQAPLRVVSRKSWEVDCNWKLMEDAFRESYHLNFIHQKTIAQMVVADNAINEMYPKGHFTLYTPYDPSKIDASISMKQSNLVPIPGTDAPDFLKNIMVAGIFPNLLFAFQLGGFPIKQEWPLGNGRTRVDITWYGMDWGNGPRPEEWDTRLLPAFDIIMSEDLGNLCSIQRSLEADPGKSIPLSSQEVMVYQFHAEMDKLIGEQYVPAGLYLPDILGAHYVS